MFIYHLVKLEYYNLQIQVLIIKLLLQKILKIVLINLVYLFLWTLVKMMNSYFKKNIKFTIFLIINKNIQDNNEEYIQYKTIYNQGNKLLKLKQNNNQEYDRYKFN